MFPATAIIWLLPGRSPGTFCPDFLPTAFPEQSSSDYRSMVRIIFRGRPAFWPTLAGNFTVSLWVNTEPKNLGSPNNGLFVGGGAGVVSADVFWEWPTTWSRWH